MTSMTKEGMIPFLAAVALPCFQPTHPSTHSCPCPQAHPPTHSCPCSCPSPPLTWPALHWRATALHARTQPHSSNAHHHHTTLRCPPPPLPSSPPRLRPAISRLPRVYCHKATPGIMPGWPPGLSGPTCQSSSPLPRPQLRQRTRWGLHSLWSSPQQVSGALCHHSSVTTPHLISHYATPHQSPRHPSSSL